MNRSVRERRRAMLATLHLAVIVLVIKLAAWWISGSHALLSDALESIVNVVTGGFGLFSIWLATQPPDDSHPYGHGRVEFFAAGLQGGMILLASVGILRESIPALWNPPTLSQLNLGLLLSAAAGLANGIGGLFLIRRGRRNNSPTMVGEGRHLLTDTLTTAGVIVGLMLVKLTGASILDSIAACLVAISIGWTGISLVLESANRLMDRADPELLSQIAAILGEQRRPYWVEIHQLRAWTGGERVHADLHLTLPRYWSLEQGHDAQRELVQTLRGRVGRPIEVLVHLDPCSQEQCFLCSSDGCPIRSTERRASPDWTAPGLTGGPAGRAADRQD